MYIKRNIKIKRSGSVPVQSTKNDLVIQSNGLGSYKYPIEEEVPEGAYASRIRHVAHTIDKFKNAAIEVYYDIEPLNQAAYRVNYGEYPPEYEPKEYRIKQKYPLNSNRFQEFADAMSKALYGEVGHDFPIDELNDILEDVDLKYPYSKIGGYTYRRPISYDDLLKSEE